MTQEDKELLLRDLCCRLPYGVICHYETVIPMIGDVINNGELQEIKHRGEYFIVNGATCLYEDIKPYLRQMSSMTEEEKKIFSTFGFEVIDHINANRDKCPKYQVIEISNFSGITEVTDWLNAHHFDYRGLIEKGLVIEAPKGMYNIK